LSTTDVYISLVKLEAEEENLEATLNDLAVALGDSNEKTTRHRGKERLACAAGGRTRGYPMPSGIWPIHSIPFTIKVLK
jgi:hypothetical protein